MFESDTDLVLVWNLEKLPYADEKKVKKNVQIVLLLYYLFKQFISYKCQKLEDFLELLYKALFQSLQL